MPRYRIHFINSEFESTDHSDYPSKELATKSAIIGASHVVSDSIADGAPSASVEVQIHDGEEMVARKVVTLSVSDLTGAM